MTRLLEPSLGHIIHPEWLRLESYDGVTPLQRVDHPVVDPIQDGLPSLGWEGDPRLCMYLSHRDGVWVLLRLEHDFEYRTVTVSPKDQTLNDQEINLLILRLMAHDQRRGFNVKTATDEHNAKLDAERDAREGEQFEAVADKLAFGFKKDLGAHF